MTLLAVMGQHGQALLRTWPWGPISALTVTAGTAVPFSFVSLAAFRDFLEYVLRKYFRRKAALAKAAGIHVRSLSRTMHPKHGKHTFSLEHCLNLAKALQPHVNARDVLLKADRTKQAQLIEELFGRAVLSDEEEALLRGLHALDASARAHVFEYVAVMAEAAARVHAREGNPSPFAAAPRPRGSATRAKSRARKP